MKYLLLVLSMLIGFAWNTAIAQPAPGSTITIYAGIKKSPQSLQFLDVLRAEMPEYTFVLEEKGGAGGIVAGNFFATAPGNGSKLLLFGAMSTLVYADLQYPDMVKYKLADIKGLTALYENRQVLVTNINASVKTLDDFKRKAVTESSQINIGVRANTDKIMCMNLVQLIGSNVQCIDYPDSFRLQQELLGEQIEFGIINASEAAAQDKLRVISPLKSYSAPQKSLYTAFPNLKKTYGGLVALAIPGSAPAQVLEFWERNILRVMASNRYKEFIDKNMLFVNEHMMGIANFEGLIGDARKNR